MQLFSNYSISGKGRQGFGQTRLTILFLVATRPGISIRELADALNIHMNAVYQHLTALSRDKLLRWVRNRARTIIATCRIEVLTPEGTTYANSQPVKNKNRKSR